jgi:SprT-like protein
MARQLTFSDIANQRTLTESTKAETDDTPETPAALLDRARQHATNVAAEHFPDLLV